MTNTMQEPITMTISTPDSLVVKQTEGEISISGPPLEVLRLKFAIELAVLELELATETERQFLKIKPVFVREG
jgi:hypothetical protein